VRTLHLPDVADDMNTPVQYSDGKYYYSSVDDGFKGHNDDGSANSGYSQYYDDFFGLFAHKLHGSDETALPAGAETEAATAGYDTFETLSGHADITSILPSLFSTAPGAGGSNMLETSVWERKFFSIYRQRVIAPVSKARGDRSRSGRSQGGRFEPFLESTLAESEPDKVVAGAVAGADADVVIDTITIADGNKDSAVDAPSTSSSAVHTTSVQGGEKATKSDDEEYDLTVPASASASASAPKSAAARKGTAGNARLRGRDTTMIQRK
jgi:hypothetical protein